MSWTIGRSNNWFHRLCRWCRGDWRRQRRSYAVDSNSVRIVANLSCCHDLEQLFATLTVVRFGDISMFIFAFKRLIVHPRSVASAIVGQVVGTSGCSGRITTIDKCSFPTMNNGVGPRTVIRTLAFGGRNEPDIRNQSSVDPQILRNIVSSGC